MTWQKLDKVGAYDVITVFGAIHDQAQPARVLQNYHVAATRWCAALMVDIKASSQLEETMPAFRGTTTCTRPR